MSLYLQLASRVEAAVAAYRSVKNFTEKAAWVERFQVEKVSGSFVRHLV
jgi:hypothetical protein